MPGAFALIPVPPHDVTRAVTAFSSEDAFAELYYTVNGPAPPSCVLLSLTMSLQMQAIKLITGHTPTSWRVR